METIIELRPGSYGALCEHLLPDEPEAEQAAFLFARPDATDGQLRLHVIDHYLVPSDEFRIRTLGHLDLLEETHERMIKRAHDLEAGIIEMHSHPYTTHGAACFSLSDRNGLADVVPHVMWRLPGRPYAAIVIAPEGLDALVWHKRGAEPRTVDAVLDGGRLLRPTGRTLKTRWGLHGSLWPAAHFPGLGRA